MKNLENYGVQELNAQEIKETDGGWYISPYLYLNSCLYAFEGVKATLGFLSGIADGITDGLKD